MVELLLTMEHAMRALNRHVIARRADLDAY
jgi:hypothetical protein